jgi:antitoxin StbD
MVARVTASEVQKNFGRWHDVAQREPVQIVKHGRESAYLVSARTFEELAQEYRKTTGVRDLTTDELELIMASEIDPEHAWDEEDT